MSANKSVTKAHLIAENAVYVSTIAAMGEEIKSLRAMLATASSTMGEEIKTLRAQMLNVTSVASAVNTMRRAYVQPQWQIDRVTSMAAAKAQAIAGKCVVRV